MEAATSPLVSVMILSFNGRRYLTDCLNSVYDQDFPANQYEVVVVDNGSTDGSADWVAANFPQVRLIRNRENLGDDAANRVLPMLRGRYAAALSQDMVVHRRWLSTLVEAMQGDPRARLVTSNIYFTWWPEFQAMERVGLPARAYVCDLTGYGVLDYYTAPLTRHSEPIPVMAADTAACMVDLKVVDELGYLVDPDFFMYGDVIDLCLRINSMGNRVLFVPQSVAYNKSDWELKLNRRTLLKVLRSARNNILAFYKVAYWSEFLAILPRLLTGHLHRASQHGLSRWRNLVYPLAAIPVALLGLFLAILHMPRTEPKRKLALNKRVTPRGWLVNTLRHPSWKPDRSVWLAAPEQVASTAERVGTGAAK